MERAALFCLNGKNKLMVMCKISAYTLLLSYVVIDKYKTEQKAAQIDTKYLTNSINFSISCENNWDIDEGKKNMMSNKKKNILSKTFTIKQNEVKVKIKWLKVKR